MIEEALKGVNGEQPYDVETEEDTLAGKYLTFFIQDEEYALEIRDIIEIVGVMPITRVPDMPAYVKGVFNLRGKIVPAVDLRLYFEMQPAEYNEQTTMIIVEKENMVLALIADRVLEVAQIDEICAAPVFTNDKRANHISGIGRVDGSSKLILECADIMGMGQKKEEAVQ